MRAYFNYQALTHGNDFRLPGDVGFLNVSIMQRSRNLLHSQVLMLILIPIMLSSVSFSKKRPIPITNSMPK
jgi:hypothetical protein